MKEKADPLAQTCSFMDVRPIMAELPYPPVQVRERNPGYANLLSIDYCGSVSEMSAIHQYMNHEIRLSGELCSVAKVLLGIAMAEMIHMQKLGELILLLGGSIDLTAKYRDGSKRVWTPQYLRSPEQAKEILATNIEGEREVIRQYKMHIKMINDNDINAVLARIIKDEEYHIMLLQALAEG